MSKPLTFLVFLLLAVSLSFNAFSVFDTFKKNTVVDVVDGDTFQLGSGKRVRLIGVDAPEYDRCGGKEARRRLTELILNKVVFLKEEKKETFGRSLALVYQGNRLINKIILEEGWGRTDYRKNSQRDALTSAFHKAQENKLGIWSSLCRESSGQHSQEVGENGCLIKGNIDKNTYKKYYHLPGCRQYNQIVIEKDIGERYFCTESEASAAGFTKASSCP